MTLDYLCFKCHHKHPHEAERGDTTLAEACGIVTTEAEIAVEGPQPGAIWGHQEMGEARSGSSLWNLPLDGDWLC